MTEIKGMLPPPTLVSPQLRGSSIDLILKLLQPESTPLLEGQEVRVSVIRSLPAPSGQGFQTTLSLPMPNGQPAQLETLSQTPIALGTQLNVTRQSNQLVVLPSSTKLPQPLSTLDLSQFPVGSQVKALVLQSQPHPEGKAGQYQTLVQLENTTSKTNQLLLDTPRLLAKDSVLTATVQSTQRLQVHEAAPKELLSHTEQIAAQNQLSENARKQVPLNEVLSSMQRLAQANPKLAPLIQPLLEHSFSLEDLADVKVLAKALAQSGLFMEAKLLNTQTSTETTFSPDQDFKSLLLKMIGGITTAQPEPPPATKPSALSSPQTQAQLPQDSKQPLGTPLSQPSTGSSFINKAILEASANSPLLKTLSPPSVVTTSFAEQKPLGPFSTLTNSVQPRLNAETQHTQISPDQSDTPEQTSGQKPTESPSPKEEAIPVALPNTQLLPENPVSNPNVQKSMGNIPLHLLAGLRQLAPTPEPPDSDADLPTTTSAPKAAQQANPTTDQALQSRFQNVAKQFLSLATPYWQQALNFPMRNRGADSSPFEQEARNNDPEGELIKLAQNAIARVQSHQLASVLHSQPQAEGAQTQTWQMEVPLQHQHTLQVRIQRETHEDEEETNSSTSTRSKAIQVWSINLAFDLPELGAIQVKAKLANQVFSGQFWAENPQTTELIQQELHYFEQTLSQAGLKVTELSCYHGIPPQGFSTQLQQRFVDEKA